MSTGPRRPLRSACYLALHCASWMTPEEERHEWLREWAAELWHVSLELGNEPSSSQLQLVSFTQGAFTDAFWMGLHAQRARGFRLPSFRSPTQCLLALLLIACSAAAFAWFLPGTRGFVRPSPYRDPRGLVLITPDGKKRSTEPQIRLEDARSWKHTAQNVFSDLAFYQVIEKRMHLAHGATQTLSIIRTDRTFFRLLGVEPLQQVSEVPQLLLSEAMWRDAFHSDPHIEGHLVIISGEKVQIAGILPRDFWRLPGRDDAWLVETDANMQQFSGHTRGFLLGRMKPALLHGGDDMHWHISAPNAEGINLGFDCTSIAELHRGPVALFAFVLVLALLALPATTSLPLGEYPLHPHQQSHMVRLRRWLFLMAKLTLLLPTLYFISLDISHPLLSISPANSEYLQLIGGFAVALFALRWMLRDQRSRCPVCLEQLQNPVHVGQPSINFLGWNGTELICVGGHGFLHVPELPTSWFSTQRWLSLDPSWRALFRPPVFASSRTP